MENNKHILYIYTTLVSFETPIQMQTSIYFTTNKISLNNKVDSNQHRMKMKRIIKIHKNYVSWFGLAVRH